MVELNKYMTRQSLSSTGFPASVLKSPWKRWRKRNYYSVMYCMLRSMNPWIYYGSAQSSLELFSVVNKYSAWRVEIARPLFDTPNSSFVQGLRLQWLLWLSIAWGETMNWEMLVVTSELNFSVRTYLHDSATSQCGAEIFTYWNWWGATAAATL